MYQETCSWKKHIRDRRTYTQRLYSHGGTYSRKVIHMTQKDIHKEHTNGKTYTWHGGDIHGGDIHGGDIHGGDIHMEEISTRWTEGTLHGMDNEPERTYTWWGHTNEAVIHTEGTSIHIEGHTHEWDIRMTQRGHTHGKTYGHINRGTYTWKGYVLNVYSTAHLLKKISNMGQFQIFLDTQAKALFSMTILKIAHIQSLPIVDLRFWHSS